MVRQSHLFSSRPDKRLVGVVRQETVLQTKEERPPSRGALPELH